MIDGSAPVILGYGPSLKFTYDPLEELRVFAVRREACAQHVITDHIQGTITVPLPVALGRPPHVGVGRLGPARQALGYEDQDTTDDPSEVKVAMAR